MTLPLFDNGVASGLLCGALFGYVLENAGLGSPRKLTAQFRFSDWTVIKVMFTAIVVAAIGLYIATLSGAMPAGSIFIPTTFFWAILTGGALVGAGMAIGGYCPGTSSVALASGRLDGLFFIVGMVLGTALFAALFDRIEGFYNAAAGPASQTLPQLFGIPAWAVLAILVVLAILGFVAGTMVEKAYGGPLTAEQTEDGGDAVSVTEIEIVEIRAG